MNLFLITFLLFSFLTGGAKSFSTSFGGSCDLKKCQLKCKAKGSSKGICILIWNKDMGRRLYMRCKCVQKRN
ncbi:unnamed protein product [Cylicocyclus nassatus]|uniref:Uncharacterized protein n=1 Tax=Cylicocyclus nassatus TaxID=53992 RepID=A0AA36M383_CYLNA|nr:unnamed protein product [Cylicocyclus nassatus]